MKTLVIAEHNNHLLKASTLHTITAAVQLQSPVVVLVAGNACQSVVDIAARVQGVDHVFWVDVPSYEHALAENIAALVVSMSDGFSHIMAPATTFGKNFLPRVAALLDVAQISDIIALISADTFVRPIYAGNALETVQSHDPFKVITVRSTGFAAAPVGETKAPVEKIDRVMDSGLSRFVSQTLSQSSRPELTVARVVISGGRGMQSSENFHLLERLADRLNAAVGASRAAVDAGFVPNDYQVGQTGKVVAPELYIAVGISGAIQHLAGMKDSKVIVAINKDADAPIFQIADYGLVGDLFEILPALEIELAKVLV